MPGHLIEGRWEAQTNAATNEQIRRVRAQGDDVPPRRSTPGGEHPPEPGRYHLYVSYACPWAHRTLIFRKLKGLESMIGVSVVHWLMGDDGWTFADGPGVIPDTVNGAQKLWQLYVKRQARLYRPRHGAGALGQDERGPSSTTRAPRSSASSTRPSTRIGAAPGDYYPQALRPQIDALNARIYETVNNGVYRCGFASTQSAYDEAVAALFATLDDLEARLAERRVPARRPRRPRPTGGCS